MTAANVGFVLLAIVLLGSALAVVTSRNLVHSVLYLALTLVATAGLYLHLDAEFLAGVQVLLYAGGVATLMIFAVMLTRKLSGNFISHDHHHRVRGLVLAAAALAVLAGGILRDGRVAKLVTAPARHPTTLELGKGFLVEYLLPFEVLSILLVAVMIGAIVIGRREDA